MRSDQRECAHWTQISKTDLQVPESEDHRLGEIHSVGSSVHGGGDDMGVDHQAPAPGLRSLAQTQAESQRGVLGSQEGAQVLIEREDQLHLACRGKRGHSEENI